MTRAVAQLLPVLDELRSADPAPMFQLVPDALWLKALLAHGAQWGEAGNQYQRIFKTASNSHTLKDQLGRFLGYGSVDDQGIRECTATRVTALSGGSLEADVGTQHRFPLPPSLSGKRGWRRLVITLAWFSPVYPLSHRWRCAHLWFTSPTSKLEIGTKKHLERKGPSWQAVQRGTLQHEVFVGQKAGAFVDGDDVLIHVSCRAYAKELHDPVPYALVVTMEVDPAIGIDIYTEIRARVISRVRVTAAG